MKTFIVAMGAMVAMTLGQDLSGVDSLAQCGQDCVNSMVGKAGELGCGAGDYACLCLNADFSYGVRDCTNQSCTDQTDAAAAQDWANSFCAGYGVAITSNGEELGATETSSGASPSATTVVASGLTSTFTTVITSGSLTITSTGTLTASGLTTTVSPTVSVGSTSTEVESTTVTSSTTTSEETSGETSGPEDTSTGPEETNGGSESTESPGLAPHATAAPVGFLAAAGIMAFLL